MTSPSKKTPESNYTKAVNAILHHFKSPLAAIQCIASIISDLDTKLELKSTYNDDPIQSVSVIKYHLTLIQIAFCKIGQLRESQKEKGIPKSLEWFVEIGNPEEVFSSLRSAIVHECSYYMDYGVSDLNNTLKDIGVFLTFIIILQAEEQVPDPPAPLLKN